MLIIFMVSTNVLLWTFSQNAIYTQAVKDENQKSADKLNENIVASSGNYSVLEDEVTVEVILRNGGSVAAQIINLWVLDTNSSNRRYANKSLNYNLNPGDALYLVGSSGVTVIISGANPSHDFISWFVTARGNTIPLEEEQEQGVIIAELAQGIGSLALDFYKFRYFQYETDPPNKLKNYPAGTTSFSVPHATDIALGVALTNLDPSKQTITLYENSLIWLYFPAVPGHTLGPVWYIVKEINGTIQSSYSSVSLEYGQTELVVFASEEMGNFSSSSKVKISDQQQKNSLGAVNLLLYGKIGDRDYGQNIPFVSLYCYET